MSKKNRCEKPCTAGAAADTAPSITDFAVAEDQLAHLREAHGVETDTTLCGGWWTVRSVTGNTG